MQLKDKIAIVTGSGRGIGRAIALEFARSGASLICCARNKAQIEETAAIITRAGGSATAICCDVTDKENVHAVIDKTVSQYGRIDVLFNNAGRFAAIGPLWEVDTESWWRDVTVNLKGPMLFCSAALAVMTKQNSGVIINMNGGGSTIPLTGGSGYGCSKAALLRLTDTLAAELKTVNSQVMVFAMGPGFVRTEMTELQLKPGPGRKWIPSSADAIEKGLDLPPENCAKAAVQLLKIADPKLSGRIFSVDTDFDAVQTNIDKIAENDLLTLRSRPLI